MEIEISISRAFPNRNLETRNDEKKMINNQPNILLKLKGLKNGFNMAEKRLTEYILKNTDKVILQKIRDLEYESGVSYATIIRFTKKLGFSGFKEFKNSLIKTSSPSKQLIKIPENFPIKPNDKINTVVKKSFQNSFNILNETQEILDIEILQKAANAISNAEKIFFLGTGDSGIIARYGYTRFLRIGLQCNHIEDSTLQKINMSLLSESDVLIAISSSGRSKNIIDCAKIANKLGAKVISLCDYAISPLSKIATIPLFTTTRDVGKFLDIERPLTIAQIHMIELLFLNTCLKIGTRAFSRYQKTKEIGDMEKEGI